MAKITEPSGGTSLVTITYGYDPLYRLTNATYTNGTVFTYTYDSVGNRLTQQTLTQTIVYTYDLANRLINAGGITYTWDANGNLLNDGVYTYTYDTADRLITTTQGANTYTFAYNGMGDRVKQTANGVVTTYTLDLNAGLTQVLADGTNTYLDGVSRIGEQQPGGFAYHLPDALGSVRQLANASASVTLARSYEPYGSVLSSAGSGATNYNFAGEWRDATNLIYLRARYYAGAQGRFISADRWAGNLQQPLSLNKWLYSLSNPVNLTDPTGQVPFLPPQCVGGFAWQCVAFASWQYSKNGPIRLAGLLWGGRFDCDNRDWSTPVNARELLADYICERGPDHVIFGGSDALTKELAYARVIDELRKRFYREGNIPKPGESEEFKFNPPEYMRSLDDILISGEPLPIMHFLGSFDYQVVHFSEVRTKTNRVVFKIDNQTDLSSGTHLPGRFPPESQKDDPLITGSDHNRGAPISVLARERLAGVLP